MKKRILVRIISYISAAFLVITGFAVLYAGNMEKYKGNLTNVYSKDLEMIVEGMNNVSICLNKGQYATSASQLATIAAEVCMETGIVKNSLSELPLGDVDVSTVNKFLSQTGDYCLFVAKNIVSGNEMTSEEVENITSLYAISNVILQKFDEIRMVYEAEGIWNADLIASLGGIAADDGFSSYISGIEEILLDYPSLIYDGPFSDHMMTGNAKMLEQEAEITLDEAKHKAADILGVDIEMLNDDGLEEGKIEAYCFSAENSWISISKRGGYVVYFRKYRQINETKITYDDAVLLAQNYLNSFEGMNFEPTYYFADEGMCVVNLAHKEGSTLCYTDLIKVGVALDTGEIMMVESNGYLTNHYKRTIAAPKYSEQEAKAKLASNLTVKNVNRVIIPTSGNTEKGCYEFVCKGLDEQEVLLYINYQTLEEEKILILLKTDGGTLSR